MTTIDGFEEAPTLRRMIASTLFDGSSSNGLDVRYTVLPYWYVLGATYLFQLSYQPPVPVGEATPDPL